MSSRIRDPLARAVLVLALILGIVTLLYYGRLLLVPLAFGALLAMLVSPIHHAIVRRGLPAWLGLTASTLLLVAVTAGILAAVGSQASRFASDWPQIQQRVAQHLEDLQQRFPLLSSADPSAAPRAATPADAEVQVPQGPASGDDDDPDGGRAEQGEEQGEEAGSAMPSLEDLPVQSGQVSGMLSSTISAIASFFLVFVYVVLFLAEEERIRTFLVRRAPPDKRDTARRTIEESSSVAQKYLRGRLILMGILLVIYCIGFSVSKLEYALFTALLAAVMSLIPYFGNLIGGALALAVAVTSGEDSTPIYGVLITMAAAQLLENYVLTPLIVGRGVSLNAMTTLLCVIGFTLVWGPVGSVLAIPIVAMLRIVCLHVEGLRDYAYLLGEDDSPPASEEV